MGCTIDPLVTTVPNMTLSVLLRTRAQQKRGVFLMSPHGQRLDLAHKHAAGGRWEAAEGATHPLAEGVPLLPKPFMVRGVLPKRHLFQQKAGKRPARFP